MMKRQPDENGRYPLSSREYEALRTLFGAINALNTDALNDRLELVDFSHEDLSVARRLMQGVSTGLLGTVPLNKLLVIKKELRDTVCELRIRPVTGDKQTDCVYVDQNALARLADRAIQMDCLLCEKSAQEGRRCPLFRDLNACFPYELDHPGDATCPFAGVSSVKMEDK